MKQSYFKDYSPKQLEEMPSELLHNVLCEDADDRIKKQKLFAKKSAIAYEEQKEFSSAILQDIAMTNEAGDSDNNTISGIDIPTEEEVRNQIIEGYKRCYYKTYNTYDGFDTYMSLEETQVSLKGDVLSQMNINDQSRCLKVLRVDLMNTAERMEEISAKNLNYRPKRKEHGLVFSENCTKNVFSILGSISSSAVGTAIYGTVANPPETVGFVSTSVGTMVAMGFLLRAVVSDFGQECISKIASLPSLLSSSFSSPMEDASGSNFNTSLADEVKHIPTSARISNYRT